MNWNGKFYFIYFLIIFLKSANFFYSKDQSLIVVDIRSLPIYKLFRSEELCGGRYEKIYECCESFFQKLSTLNVKLIFFTQMINFLEDHGKRKIIDNVTAQNSILDDVKEGKTLAHIIEYYNTEVINNIAKLKIGILQIASKYGRIERCIHKTNMAREMCAFAVENKAHAIITDKQATYFVENDLLVWAANPLCMINFTTTQIDTGIARNYLKLEKHHMPILGTLLGNHIILGKLMSGVSIFNLFILNKIYLFCYVFSTIIDMTVNQLQPAHYLF